MRKKHLFLLAILIAPVADVLHADEDYRCNSIYFDADVLFWKPHISSLELLAGNGSIIQTTSGGTTTTVMEEFDVDPHFKWDTGYRIEAGYQFDCREWDLGLIWTHFQGNGTKNVREDSTTTNTTKGHIKFDQLDFVLGYNATPYSCINFTPFVGIRGAKIHEGLRASLITDITFTPSTLATSTRSLDDSQNYHGIGPILGIQGSWDLECGFSLYGSATAGLLYGNYRVHFDDIDISTAPISTSVYSHNKRHLHSFDPNIDLAIGIKWDATFCDEYQIGLKLCFEHHQYFNQSHLGTDRGDLTFDGGAFGVDVVY